MRLYACPDEKFKEEGHKEAQKAQTIYVDPLCFLAPL
jgi:hypothetical protein